MLPEGADLPSAKASLAEHLDVRADRATSGTTTFYDTFDGRLHAAGLTLRHSGTELVLLDRETGATLASAAAPAAKRLFDRDLPEALRARLAPEMEMRALLPVAKVRTHRLPLAVLNGDAKTVVRLELTTADNGTRGRVTATAVRGYEAEIERVRATLAETLALPEATVPLVDEAIAAAGGDPAGTSSKLALTLDPDEPASLAAATVFGRLLEVIDLNLPGTLDDVDSEFLHDLRVAIRRTRSLQRQFKGVYPERLQHFRDEFKRLQAVTGDLRDLDVYLLDFPELRDSLPEKMRADLDPLRDVLEQRRVKALTATRRALRAQRTGDALAEWNEFVTSRRPSDRTVSDLASHRITRVYRKMVKMGRAIDDDSPAYDLHELRKVGKELRYLLEFFASLYPPEIVKPFVKTLKGLQDQLGRFQDREVQANALRDLAPAVKGHPFTLMAMGVLIERFMQEEIAARAEFADRFAVFASKAQRDVVKEHFG
ncbi:CHAD domain-containing protein [Solirubrobacter sp. CPCC 204708]|uniref:CHAD domain-containing protein n=1 Tax=Solirubrobacter deserti TaxID=2282478 RepID=A0ABT4RJ41_9ACTN|nr:CHAD domain-containing protein [Solirubrobacter deserti]MBE2317615.1 CHAD domain-containing protein [Solirubrobacter deserti]MDA0138564.1 CHAD domain-containing protein [Solirubrobacter deserti]